MPHKFVNTLVPALIAGVAYLGVAYFGAAAHGAKGYSSLYTFCTKGQICKRGDLPFSGVTADTSGNLYGATVLGGANSSCFNGSGCGTIYEITPLGKESVLYSFCNEANCADGANPRATPLRDQSGNLFGTTEFGGANNGGAVYELSADGTESVLYSFCNQANCADGLAPYSNLITDSKGNFYGTTRNGGPNNCGVVFKLKPDGRETVLHSFGTHSNDGCQLLSGVIMDREGNLFGSTSQGGAGKGGTVFEITAAGKEKVLYSFCFRANCEDGDSPSALIEDPNGKLYGTTGIGGKHGNGVLFTVSPTGVETVIHSFCAETNCADGGSPYAGLLAVKKFKKIYGTAIGGGNANGGVVFEFELKKGKEKEKVLHSFASDTEDGGAPYSPVIKLGGWLVGTTTLGASSGDGSVFELGAKGDGS